MIVHTVTLEHAGVIHHSMSLLVHCTPIIFVVITVVIIIIIVNVIIIVIVIVILVVPVLPVLPCTEWNLMSVILSPYM